MKRVEIRLAGFGGQGILLAGAILARAAAIYEKKEVFQWATYGAGVRGGACRSDIILSDEPNDYPVVSNVDFLIAMSQEACDAYIDQLNPKVLLLIDPHYVKEIKRKVNYIEVPSTQLAISFGKPITANMIMVGAFVSLTGILSESSVRSAMNDLAPEKEINLKALQTGFQIGKRLSSRNLESPQFHEISHVNWKSE